MFAASQDVKTAFLPTFYVLRLMLGKVAIVETAVYSMSLVVIVLLLFPAAMTFAAAMDLFTMTIPNWLSLALVAGFFCLAPFVELNLSAASMHLGLGVAMLLVGFGMFAMGWIGGGDAKFFAATALWMGPEHLLEYVIVTALLGGVLTIAIIALRTVPLPAVLGQQSCIARLYDAEGGIPYGIALAGGGLLIYPQTVWMMAVAG